MAPKAGRGRTAEKTLASVLGIRLEQLAAEHTDLPGFLVKVGISPGTYYLLVKGDANPTLRIPSNSLPKVWALGLGAYWSQ